MENQHLTYFKVENFKKFDSLEVKDIGQFNLIVGDNNVGKTCLLEALLINEDATISSANFMFSLFNRKILNVNRIDLISIVNHLSKNGNKIQFKLNDNNLNLSFNESDFDLNKIKEVKKFNELLSNIFRLDISEKIFKRTSSSFNYPLISFNANGDDIIDLYNQLSTKSDKENLIEILKVIFPKIIDVEYKIEFKQISETFVFSFEDKNEFIPLNYLGDGFKRIFYIILKVLSLKGKRIMIDEIETGIHHSRQKDFLKNVMKVCRELDVQLFATTHSEECIRAFYEASMELGEQESVRLISLEEGKNEKIYATTNRFENITAGLISNVEFRK